MSASETSSLGQELYDATTQAVLFPGNDKIQYSRSAVTSMHGFDIDLNQSKYALSDEEKQRASSLGAAAFATNEWFNDVQFNPLKGVEGDGRDWHEPLLFATYPMEFFEGHEPSLLNDDGSGAGFQDSYGSGSLLKEGRVVDLHDPFARTITEFSTADPENQEAYFDRARWYLEQLSINPTIFTDTFWNGESSVVKDGLMLSDISVSKALRQGSFDFKEYKDAAYIFGQRHEEGFILYALPDGSMPKVKFWDNDRDIPPAPASEKLTRAVMDMIVSLLK